MKLINSDDMAVSFDAAAHAKAATKVIADVLSGRITPAEARALNAELGQALKAAELVIKCGRMSKRRGVA
jgi:hypothetical protein